VKPAIQEALRDIRRWSDLDQATYRDFLGYFCVRKVAIGPTAAKELLSALRVFLRWHDERYGTQLGDMYESVYQRYRRRLPDAVATQISPISLCGRGSGRLLMKIRPCSDQQRLRPLRPFWSVFGRVTLLPLNRWTQTRMTCWTATGAWKRWAQTGCVCHLTRSMGSRRMIGRLRSASLSMSVPSSMSVSS